jgi:hypothetical protein
MLNMLAERGEQGEEEGSEKQAPLLVRASATPSASILDMLALGVLK